MHDAVVIGARCAGTTTALLLARKGLDVLLVDRARFPSDIPHGHFIHRHGPRRLAAWGLLDKMLATGCPPITSITSDLEDFPLVGRDLAVDGVPVGLGPRRVALDQVLVKAAVDPGTELREGFPVDGLVYDGDRVAGVTSRGVTERARYVVGADGRNSSVAKWVQSSMYEEAPTATCWYFSYWSGFPATGWSSCFGTGG